MSILKPTDANQIAEMISWVVQEGDSLEIVGGGTKRALGRPMKTDHVLDVSRFEGIVAYEPAELVLTVRPGEPLASINAELRKNRQMLAFEPPDWRALLGAEGAETLGGVVACNMAGSRRVRSGSPRDYVLGFSAVNGFGEIWKAGGKVVKNVTGYDMCKLQAGAYGTLSALTEITLKVMPGPETACTIVLHGLADEAAISIAGACAQFAVRGFRRGALAQLRSAPFEDRRCGAGPGRRRRCGWKVRGRRSPIAPARSNLLVGRGARLNEIGDGSVLVGSRRRSALSRTRIAHRLAPLSDAKPGAHRRPFNSVRDAIGGIVFRLGRRTDLAEPGSRRGGAGRRREHCSARGEIGGRPRHA